MTFGDIVPSQLRVLPLATGAGRVARKVKREILPVRSETFSYNSSPEMEFHISAGKDMLIPRECYLRFTLNVKSLLGTVPDAGCRLSSHGVHGLFRRLEISDRANRLIEVIDEYDHVSNVVSHVYDNKDYCRVNNFIEGQSETTTPAKNGPVSREFPKTINEQNPLDMSVAARSVDVAINGTTVTRTSGPVFTAENSVGRFVNFYRPDELVHTAVISVRTDDDTVTIIPAYPLPRNATGDLAAETGVTLVFMDEPDRVGYNEDREFVMKLQSGLFESYQDLPLFLMDGLNIKLYLQQDSRPFINSPLGTDVTLDYTIKDARFVCNLRTPSAELRDQYLEMFNKGLLNYPFMTYHAMTKFSTGNAVSRVQFDLPISKSSIKKCFFVIQSDTERGNLNSGNGRTNSFKSDSFRYVNAGLSEFQFKIGAMDYPAQPMRIPDKYAANAFAELQICGNKLRDDLRVSRITLQDWIAQSPGYTLNGSTNWVAEPLKRIFGVRFDTIEDDMLSGVKTRGIGTDDHIVADLNFTQPLWFITSSFGTESYVETQRYVTFIFEHSKVLHISKRGILALD